MYPRAIVGKRPSATSCRRSSYMGNITWERSTGHFGSNQQSLFKSITSHSRDLTRPNNNQYIIA